MTEPRPPSITLENVPSQHPKLRLQISEVDLEGPAGCTPYLIVSLPPAMYVDPYELPPHRALGGTATRFSTSHIAVQDVSIAGKTELEKSVGWTDPQGSRRRIASKRSSELKANLAHDFALSSENTAIVFKLKLDDPSRPHDYNFMDAMDSILRNPGVDGKVEPGKKPKKAKTAEQLSRMHTLDIPIHARYLPPVPTGFGVAAGQPLQDWRELLRSLLDPSKGHYEQVEVPKPKLIYSCAGEPTPEEGFKMGWEYIQPDSILGKQWVHLKLSPPLPTSTDVRKHRLLAPIAPPDKASDAPYFKLPVPQGDASVTTLTQLVTAATICLTAFYVLLSVRSTLSRVEKSERALRKLLEGKTQ